MNATQKTSSPNPATLGQYNHVVAKCRSLFLDKLHDYGTSWRLLRPTSVTDQLFIKARRIRTIQDTGTQKVNDSIESEFIGLVIYAVIALIQLRLPPNAPIDLSVEETTRLYDDVAEEIRRLMLDKNHDYGEAWRDMRIPSITDMILVKLHRIKQMEDLSTPTRVSEPPMAGYMDIFNYAIFALIMLGEGLQPNPNGDPALSAPGAQ